MSQESHTEYKKLCILKGKYYKYKDDTSPYMVDVNFKARYDYLKQKLKYLTIHKHDDWYERLSMGNTGWGLTTEQESLLQRKMETDDELVALRRIVLILKIKLLKTGYNKIYL